MSAITTFLDRWKIPKSRAIVHVVISVFTAGFWILIAVALELYIASSRENRAWKIRKEYREYLESLRNKIEVLNETLVNVKDVKRQVKVSVDSQFEIPFELPIAWLWESREQITSITSGTTLGKTRTGTVGVGWNDGIGWAASQGVTRGTIASQTTEMISNEFMQLDSGVLRITREFTAFIGNQFSRTGHYRDILAINTDYDKGIGLGIVNAERIWLTRFPGEFEKEIALALIKYAHSLAQETKPANLDDLFEEFAKNTSEIELEITNLERELENALNNEPIGTRF